jgi:hypothetical protein
MLFGGLCNNSGAIAMQEPIRVFVSYSGDDWESFVKHFATELRRNGLDAVAADWDLQGGQSLVQWILEEELPRAEAVVIVLSKTSITKPWVREELDHATVMRIMGKIKLIPVRIDDCEIPHSLQTLKRFSIHHPGEQEAKIQEVIDSIYGHSRRPPIGEPPAYTQISSPTGYTQMEWTVLSRLGEKAWNLMGDWLDPSQLYDDADGLGLTESQLTDTLVRLKSRGFIEGQQYATGTGQFGSLRFTVRGGGIYCRQRVPDFHREKKRIAASLASVDARMQLRLDPPEGVPSLIFRTSIDELASARLIRVQWIPSGNRVMVIERSPLLNDWLEQN